MDAFLVIGVFSKPLKPNSLYLRWMMVQCINKKSQEEGPLEDFPKPQKGTVNRPDLEPKLQILNWIA